MFSFVSEQQVSVGCNRKLVCTISQHGLRRLTRFTLCTKYIGNLVEKHNLQRQFYADDSQLFVFKPTFSWVRKITNHHFTTNCKHRCHDCYLHKKDCSHNPRLEDLVIAFIGLSLARYVMRISTRSVYYLIYISDKIICNYQDVTR